MSNQYKPIVGATKTYTVTGKDSSSVLQLIAWKSGGEARKMIVTLGQIMKGSPPQVGPWRAGSSLGGTGAGYGAPDIGRPEFRLQWGVGGVRQQTVMPWPVTGGSFTITAESVDVDAFSNPADLSNASDQPQFTAWIMPGDTSSEQPLWSKGQLFSVAFQTIAPAIIRGSFVKSWLITTAAAPAAIPSALMLSQWTTSNVGAWSIPVGYQNIGQALKDNGAVEVLADPSCSQAQIENDDAALNIDLWVREKYVFS